MSVSYGPNLGKMINALTGDPFDVDFRAFLRAFDALLQGSVKSRTLTAPPGSPANGDRYIVGAAPTGAWTGQANAISVWTTDNPTAPSGNWEFYAPKTGWLVYSVADAAFFMWSGSAWTAFSTGGVTSLNSLAGALTIEAGTNVTVTVSGSDIIIAAAGGGGGSSTLAGDSDVAISSPSDGQLLTYNGSSSKWMNAAASGGGGGITRQAGVPTGAGSSGSLIGVTDGGLGDSIYSYVGQKTGLPLVVNRGNTYTADPSGNPTACPIPMQRAVVAGDLLVAFYINFGGTPPSALSSGWTSLANYGADTSGAAYRVANGTEGSSVSPWTAYTAYAGTPANGTALFCVEVSNQAASSPVLSTAQLTTAATNITAALHDLVLVFNHSPQYPASVPPLPGVQDLGMVLAPGNIYGARLYSWSLTKETTGAVLTEFRIWPDPGIVVGNSYFIVVVLKNGPATVNWWRPIG